MAAQPSLQPTCPPPVAQARRPNLKLPKGACDCHAHIFGPYSVFPLAAGNHYVPPEASIDSYINMLRTIGCERAVIVHPSVYGTDNRVTLDALRSARFPCRGVAVIDEQVTDEALEDMHQAGMRGIRITVRAEGGDAVLASLPRLAQRIKARGWHMQFFLPGPPIPDIDSRLIKLPVDIVIDHFGQIKAEDGVASPAFQTLLRLARHERCWFKLMGPYRVSKQTPLFQNVTPFARALAAAAPDRCVWGTDWPHPNVDFISDEGDLVDMLSDWLPDADLRSKVLVANPTRLYDFH